MGFIYLINTVEGKYIGQLADKYVLEDHLRRSHMFRGQGAPKEAWEARWIADLRENGLQNSNYILGMQYWDESIIKANLEMSFDQILQINNYQDFASGAEFFTWIRKMWGRNDDRSVIEALCILLAAAKDNQLLNLKIDFLSHSAGLDVNKLFTKEEVARVQSAVRKKWMPSIFYTITAENFDLEALDDEFNKTIQETWQVKPYIRVNVLKHPKVTKAMTKMLTDSSKETIIKQLENFKKYLQNNRHVTIKSVYDYVDDVIQMVRNSNASSRFQLIEDINRMFEDKAWQKKIARTYNFSTVNRNINVILDLLHQWYNNTSINSILGDLDIHTPLPTSFINHYKREFCRYIQTFVFPQVQEQSYQDWKSDYTVVGDEFESTRAKKDQLDTWLEGDDERTIALYMQPGNFYPYWYENIAELGEYTAGSLFEKTQQIVESFGNFVFSNWINIYPEQVALYLTKHDFQFTYTNMNSAHFNMNWYNTMVETEIQYY